jgi:RES domain-containing protein
VRVWRVVLAGHEAFDGEGTRRFESRWIPTGLPAIYTSATLSLATLELFVHTDPDLAPVELLAISADIPDDLFVHEIAMSDLPRTWREIPAPAELQELGRSWIVERKTAVLSVPSVVVPTERNYVLNPAHGGFRRIQTGEAHDFSFDPRMWKAQKGGHLQARRSEANRDA